ncbi:hypothetical protein HK102_008137 [Quaeritorhiza haematococci]|nr:hypothetical protein HK102_008137 [Quaeritorhiza haematococci]
MRPDDHKQKASRRWKAKHGVPSGRGGSTSANSAARGGKDGPTDKKPVGTDVEAGVKATPNARPQAPQQASKPPAVQRSGSGRGSDDDSDEGDNMPRAPTRYKYARRTIESNAYRYEDPSANPDQGVGLEDLDQETEDLLDLIRTAGKEDHDSSGYFQFKDEQHWTSTENVQAINSEFDMPDLLELETSLSLLSLGTRLGIPAFETWDHETSPATTSTSQPPAHTTKPLQTAPPQPKPQLKSQPTSTSHTSPSSSPPKTTTTKAESNGPPPTAKPKQQTKSKTLDMIQVKVQQENIGGELRLGEKGPKGAKKEQKGEKMDVVQKIPKTTAKEQAHDATPVPKTVATPSHGSGGTEEDDLDFLLSLDGVCK